MHLYRSFVVLAVTASAAVAASLSDHTNFTTYDIDSVSEASAVTYSRDTDTLYSIGDEGAALVQISKTGAFIDQMTFDNSGPREGRTLDDPEGLSYANGQIYISDERRNVAWKTTYAPGTQVGKGIMPSYAFGAPEGNTGLEGISFDPTDGSLWGVKESSTATIYKMTNPEGSPTVSEPVEMRFLNRLDLSQYSDIYVMANSAAFSLTDPRRLNLLLLSEKFQPSRGNHPLWPDCGQTRHQFVRAKHDRGSDNGRRREYLPCLRRHSHVHGSRPAE